MPRLLPATRGTAAIEFAVTGSMLLLLLCAVIENGIVIATQSVLDNATQRAARLIRTGQAQGYPGQVLFQNKLCNDADVLLACSGIEFSVLSRPNMHAFQNRNPPSPAPAPAAPGWGIPQAAGWDPGDPGDFVLVQVAYNRPFLIPWFGAALFQSSSLMLVSTAVFENEQLPIAPPGGG